MIHSTKRGQYWSFWCQGWSNNQDQEVFWWNRALEAVEASEVAEDHEVNEAAEVLGPEKSLLRTSESSRSLNSSLFWCFEKLFWGAESWNIMLNFSTFFVGGCWGQLMLFLWKMVELPQNFYLSAFQNHLQTKFNLHIFIRQSQFIKSISKWDTLY